MFVNHSVTLFKVLHDFIFMYVIMYTRIEGGTYENFKTE